MEKTILEIKKDIEGLLVVNINNEVAWEISDKFKNLLIEELQNHLGGDFSDELDPPIDDAINKIMSCIKSSDLEDNGPHIYRVK